MLTPRQEKEWSQPFLKTIRWKHFHKKAKGYGNENEKKVQQEIAGVDKRGKQHSEKA